MVAKCNGMVVHQLHDIGDVLAFGDGSRGVTLQEITATDDTDIGRIRLADGIAQACHLLITIDTTMGVVFIKNHNTLLCSHRKTAHHQSHQANA